MEIKDQSERLLRAPLLVALACLVANAAPVRAEDLDPSAIQWSSLSLRARRLTVTFNAAVSIEQVDAEEAFSQFLSRPDGQAVKPRAADVVLMTLSTRGLGRQSETRLWVEPSDGVALQRSQLDSGRRDRFTVHRNESTGVFTLRRSPAEGQEDRPHEEWTEVRETVSPFPDWAGEGMEVSDPTALFYFLAVAKLEQVGDSLQFPVFSRDQLLLVDLTVTGRERTRVSFTKLTDGRSEDIGGRRELIKILIDGSHLGPGSAEEDFEFLGLRGDVEILLDPELRAPVEVSGRVPRAGRVRLRLREVEIR